MVLSFKTARLRTVCQDHRKAVKDLGVPAADALRTRLADLRAVTYLADLPVGGPTVEEGNPPKLSFELAGGWSLHMVVAHGSIPRDQFGQVALDKVFRVRIEEVSHD